MKKTLISFLIVLGTIKIFGQNQCPDVVLAQDFNDIELPYCDWPPCGREGVILSLEEYPGDPGNKYFLMEWHENLIDSTWFTDIWITNFDPSYSDSADFFADWELYKEDPVITFKANNSGKSNVSLRIEYFSGALCSWGTSDYWSDVNATDEWGYYSFRLKDMTWKTWSGSAEMSYDSIPIKFKVGFNSINPTAFPDYDIQFKIDDLKVYKYGCDYMNIRDDQTENIKSHSVEIYPKPANDYLRITSISEINEIEIIDISGRSMSQTFHNSKEIELDISQFKNGVYLIKVRTANGTFFDKILKVK